MKGYGDEWLPILRMYRGVFLLVMLIFLVAINTCGWRAAGVNHVLIFELNPRTHLTYQQVLEVRLSRVSPATCCQLVPRDSQWRQIKFTNVPKVIWLNHYVSPQKVMGAVKRLG